MDWSRVPVFLKVVEAESITRAAEALGLPKSTVSRTVTALEQDLSTQLLTRTTRQLKLTDAGRDFYQRARAARAALEEAEAALDQQTDDAQGVVRVTVAPNAWPMAELFTRFTRLHPRVHVEVVATNRHVNLVDEGVDLAIRAGSMPDSTLLTRKIASSDLALYATRSYLTRHGEPRRLADLNEHEVVLFRARQGAGVLKLTGPDGDFEVAVKGRVSADDLGFIRAFVSLGAGIGLLPMVLSEHATPDGKLVRVLPDYRVKGSGMHLVMPAARYVPTRVRLLADFIVAQFDQAQLCRVAKALSKAPARGRQRAPKR
ncbi:MAG: LysR family transcriptional regulator, partial [Myxococcota bacterium]